MSTSDRGNKKSRGRSEDMFRLLFESVADALFLHDLEGRFVEVNQAACDSLGYTRKELLRLPFSTIVKDADLEAFNVMWSRVMQGEKLTVQGFHQRRDGAAFPVEVHLSPFEYAGRPHILASARDITERRRVEEELLHIKFAVDNVSDAIGMATKDGRHFYHNQAFERLFEYSIEEIRGLHPEVVFASKSTAREVFDTILAGNSWRGETEMVTKFGRHFPVSLRSDAIKDANGNIVGLIGIHTDITERKQSEEALRKEKLFTEAILDSLPGTFFLFDVQGKQLRTNRSGLAASGYSMEELSQMHALDTLTEEDREAGQRALADVLAKGEASVEAQMLTKDGRKIPFLFTAKKFIIDDIPHILGTGLDITARKETEKALQESEERFRLLAAAAFEGIILHDKGLLLAANDQYCEMFGYALEDLIGKQALPLTVAPEALESMRKKIAAGSLGPYESIGLKKDGTKFPMEIRVREMEYEGRKVRMAAIMDITERRRSEEALRESEERYRSLFHNHHTVMLLIDPETGAIMDANPAAVTYYGYGKEELLTKKTTDLNTLPSEQVLQAMQRAKKEGQKHFEFQHRLASGEIRDVEIYAEPIRIDGRELLYSIIHDVTARRQAEEALRKSEKKYRSLYHEFQGILNTIPDTVCLLSPDLTIVWANLVDYSEVNLSNISEIGKLCYPQRHGCSEPCKDCPVLRCFKSGKMETEIHSAHGRVWELRAFPIYDDNGELQGGLEVARDITESKRTEEALRESQALYQDLVETAQDLVWQCDAEGRYTYLNPAWEEVFGYKVEDMLGRRFTDFQPPEYATRDAQEFVRLLEGNFVKGLETVHLAKDGRELHLVFNAKVVRDEDGRASGTRGSAYNITERKLGEKALRESENKFRSLYLEFQGILDTIPDVLCLISPDLRIVWGNEATAKAIPDKNLADIIGEHCYELRHERSEPCESCPVLRCFGSGKIETKEVISFGELWELRAVPIYDDQGELRGAIEVARNITERKRMEEALEKRVVALSRPLDDAAEIDFDDLFNLEEMQRLSDLFAKSTGVAALITTPDGRPITQPSNFCRLCSSFIRQTEQGRKRCAASDASLGRYNPDGPTIHHCLSAGLFGAGASISVGGKHIANWLIGQVRDETVTEESLRNYARELSLDEEEFIAAFQEVPIMSADQFKLVAQALFNFANQLSAAAYQNVQQARFITELKQAEERLLATQERLALALKGGDLGTWDWNVQTGEIIVNKRWTEMLGYTLEEIEPDVRFWKKLIHPDEFPAVMEILNAHLEGQTLFYETEYRLRHKSGSWVWVLDKGKAIERDAQGKAVRACGTHLDITERKMAEGALRDSEERLRLALEAANQGLYDLDIQTGETKVSPEYATMLGYDPDEFQETNARWIERLHPDDREEVAATYQDYIRGDIPNYEVEFRQRTQSGDWKWILSLGKVVAWDEDGKPRRMMGTHTDITERKKAEEALRESEKRLREAQEMAHLGFWHWNVKTGDVTWSDEVYNMFHLDPKKFTPHINSIMELSPWPEDRERDQELIQKAMESHEKGTFEQRFLLPDNSIGYYYSTFQGKYDEGGNLIFIFGTVLDITERKRAEEERIKLEAQMLEVQKLESLGVLAGGIAHDFNNLLMAILGNADLALLTLSPASPAYPNVEQIVRASQRAADLCGQMLAYSGKGRFVVGHYNLSEIVQEMAQMLKVSVSKKAALRYFFDADLPAVEVDVTQMRQVIMNLITNASEALGDRTGIISVSTGVMDCDRDYLAESYLDDKLPEGKYVYLEVADTGSGIDEETRRRMFDPFFTTKFTGRGLGLAAVLGIVRGHQGAIKVYSEVGKGSTFKVLLPAREWVPGERRDGAAQSDQPLSGGGTILIVDDDPEVRDVGTQMLERLGFKVLTAAHGREGLKIFQKCGDEIDCVILDLTMPEMGGEEVFRELRRLRKDVRVILSSGYNEQEVTQRFVGKGLAGFIKKPYRVANLHEILKRVFG